MANITQITGSGIPLFIDDIDTDRIIPARYLRCVTFDGLGEHAFEDDRQQNPDHPFNDDRFQNGSILVSGNNFGCGSSREHAPQSLMRWGIKAVIAESFAEIFFGNCTALGIPAVTVSRADAEQLATTIEKKPLEAITIDLEEKTVCCGAMGFSCNIPESARIALVTGEYDFLAQLLEGEKEIKAATKKIPYLAMFTE
ncbi:3-isopropylmalate dehydratase small subunit [hydrothermal vent metagenome]|uniref:3-isopropylmalate dehydratase n=1 Tax=hydrothermal vent metagenome TaxID=652676 RepID=A0A3B1D3J7_9ZZZZ